MAFKIRDSTETTLSEINVTPLVDVMLVLLIIFMITAPMLSASVDVQLEQGSVAPTADAKETLVISITADERLYVADQLTDLAILEQRTMELGSRLGLHDVAIRADRRVPYGVVLQVLDRLHRAEIKNVGLVMDPPDAEGTP